MVPERVKIGLADTAVDFITGVPVLVVDPVAFVTVTVVDVDAVITKLVPLFPVAPPVYPEMVTAAPAQPFDPAPDSEAARVYTQLLPDGLVGAVLVLKATVVADPVTVGVVLAHENAAARPEV